MKSKVEYGTYERGLKKFPYIQLPLTNDEGLEDEMTCRIGVRRLRAVLKYIDKVKEFVKSNARN